MQRSKDYNSEGARMASEGTQAVQCDFSRQHASRLHASMTGRDVNANDHSWVAPVSV
jgi:hypothetical protein